MLDLNKNYNDTNSTYDSYNRMPDYGRNDLTNCYDNAQRDMYRAPNDPMNMSDGIIRGTSRTDYKPLIICLVITAILSLAVWLTVKHFAKSDAPIGFGMIFFIAGSIVFWNSILKCISKKKICTQPVTALCYDLHVSVSRDSDGHTSKTFSPVWRYYYNGNYYEHHERSSSNIDVPRVGQEYTLMIDPNDPLTIYRKSITQMLFMLVFGLVFMTVPLIMVIMIG
jgi:hypothetical protein